MTRSLGVRFPVHSIMVAIDSSPHASAALEAAARLAVRLQAEIQGVFVEDINLVHLSELPLGREVRLLSGQMRDFDRKTLETDIKSEAGRVRRVFDAKLKGSNLRGVFKVVRGNVEAEVLNAAKGADLLVLGLAGHSAERGTLAGSTALASAARAARSVLLLRAAMVSTDRAVVLFDDGPGALRALEAAANMVGNQAGELILALPAGAGLTDEAVRALAREVLGEDAPALTISRETPAEPSALCLLAHEKDAGLLVVAADNPILANESHRPLLESVGCPLLLVR